MAQRDPNTGRFLPGNSASKGRGRPSKEKEQEYYNATVSSVSLTAWKQIVKRAILDAQRGNAAARSWLTNILMSDTVEDNSGLGVPDTIEVAIKKIYGEPDGDTSSGT